MPRWASRITLEVTGVRFERLQEITSGDCDREGIYDANRDPVFPPWTWDEGEDHFETPRLAFAALWDSINKERGFGWDVNPWVVVIGFYPFLRNVDQMKGGI